MDEEILENAWNREIKCYITFAVLKTVGFDNAIFLGCLKLFWWCIGWFMNSISYRINCIICWIKVAIYLQNLDNRPSSWKNVLGILVSVKETSTCVTCVTQQNQNYSQRDLSVWSFVRKVRERTNINKSPTILYFLYNYKQRKIAF